MVLSHHDNDPTHTRIQVSRSDFVCEMYANSEDFADTQEYYKKKRGRLNLTKICTKELSVTQRNWPPNSAKPLFVGSIPTAAFLESISYGQPIGCP